MDYSSEMSPFLSVYQSLAPTNISFSHMIINIGEKGLDFEECIQIKTNMSFLYIIITLVIKLHYNVVKMNSYLNIDFGTYECGEVAARATKRVA